MLDAEYADVLARLPGLVGPFGSGGRYRCLCPLHADHRPSVYVQVGATGRLLLNCYVCGTQHDRHRWHQLLGALGLGRRTLKPGEPPLGYDTDRRPARPPPEPTELYDYVDGSGALLYQACRFERPGGRGKAFLQRRPDPGRPFLDRRRGPWVNDVAGVRRVVYRLPEVLADGEPLLCWFEGEKKADLCRRLGLPGTCIAGGASAPWDDAYSAVLAGRDVAVFPDNDPPGEAFAARVLGHAVLAGARSVRAVRLKGLPEKGDLIDWHALVRRHRPRWSDADAGHALRRRVADAAATFLARDASPG